jgi:hypothetical protein
MFIHVGFVMSVVRLIYTRYRTYQDPVALRSWAISRHPAHGARNCADADTFAGTHHFIAVVACEE